MDVALGASYYIIKTFQPEAFKRAIPVTQQLILTQINYQVSFCSVAVY